MEGKIKKLSLCLFAMILLLSCGSNRPQADKIVEHGVEVVLNHLEPYRVKGESAVLVLDKELRIDFGNKEFEELGLRFPEFVDTDSEGNMYIGDHYRRSEYLIDKFDKTGRLLKSFGRRGQGPGEIQYIYDLEIYANDRILVSDPRNRKTIEFDTEGRLVKESRYSFTEVIPFENGNNFAIKVIGDPSGGAYGLDFCVFNSDYSQGKRLDHYDLRKPGFSDRRIRYQYYCRVSGGRLYVWNEQTGYEIQIYDLEGMLLKKLRKEYRPVEYAGLFKQELEGIPQSEYPDLKSMPPINSFFVDTAGRIFAMTYERDQINQAFVHDIFSPEGIFIGRASIPAYGKLGKFINSLRATFKNGRFYRIWHKEDGNIELIVYRMSWGKDVS